MMKIYTKTGDTGNTGLFGGKRVPKSALRIHAYGTVDELNAVLGVILAHGTLPTPVDEQLHTVQQRLFLIGTDLSTPTESNNDIPRVEHVHINEVEEWIDGLDDALPELTKFILPNGSALGAHLHQARTICRRAERYIVGLAEKEPINAHVITFINRLSDYLFVAARTVNKAEKREETSVDIRAQSATEIRS